MANTFISLHYHVIFSSKDREPRIHQDIEQRVWSYLGGIARENDMKALLVGGIENHVHLLLGIPAVLSVSKAFPGRESIYYAFLCTPCRISATLYQQT